jgi:DegV family protein with EDD domain
MPSIRLVTDSTACFADTDFPRQHHITVLPMSLKFGQAMVKETEIALPRVFQRVADGEPIPAVVPPSVEQFAATFEELARTTDAIVAMHFSGKLSRAPQNARAGAEHLRGRCKIHVIDSLSTSIGLGLLVETAVQCLERGEAVDDLVRRVRGKIPNLYGAFFTDTMDYLARAELVGPAHSTLGEMLGVKPFLTLEEGSLVTTEKVRTRAQAIEKLVEFVIEFAEMDRCAILQNTPRPTADTRSLLEQLAVEFPGRQWPLIAYHPVLGALLGPDAMGVIIHERGGGRVNTNSEAQFA